MSPYVYIYQTQYHVESSALLSIYALVVFVSKFYSFAALSRSISDTSIWTSA